MIQQIPRWNLIRHLSLIVHSFQTRSLIHPPTTFFSIEHLDKKIHNIQIYINLSLYFTNRYFVKKEKFELRLIYSAFSLSCLAFRDRQEGVDIDFGNRLIFSGSYCNTCQNGWLRLG